MLLAALALLGVGVLWLIREPIDESVGIPMVLSASDDVVEFADHRTSHVIVPTGRYELTVGPARRGIEEGAAEDLPEGVQSDSGVRYLEVGWRLDRHWWDDPHRTAAPEAMRPFHHKARVAVVADGRRYPVTDREGTEAGHVFMAVEGRPHEVTFAVTYDGLTQTVHPAQQTVDPGAAAPFYERDEWRDTTASCTRASRAPDRRSLAGTATCRAEEVLAVPYVEGPGWTKAGRTWVVLDLDSSQSMSWGWLDAGAPWKSIDRNRAQVAYRLHPREARERLSGSDPAVRTDGFPADGILADRRLVFDAPAARHRAQLEVTRTFLGTS